MKLFRVEFNHFISVEKVIELDRFFRRIQDTFGVAVTCKITDEANNFQLSIFEVHCNTYGTSDDPSPIYHIALGYLTAWILLNNLEISFQIYPLIKLVQTIDIKLV